MIRVEALYLPLMLLTVALLGGLRLGDRIAFVPPPLFTLVLAVLLMGVIVRGGVLAPERLMHATRTALENLNGLVVILAAFFASAQIFHLIIPDAGLPFLLFSVLLFLLLLNTLAGAPDRLSVLRSLAVITGSSFVLKFIVLAALSEPGDGMLKRMLLVIVDGITLGTLSQQPIPAASGYVAFGTIVLYLVAVAMLPAQRRGEGHSILIRSIR